MLPILALAITQQPAAAPAKASAKPAFAITISKALVGIRPIAFAPAPTGGRVAMGIEDNSIRIIDAITRMTQKTLAGHKRPVQSIAWSPNGRWIASGDESARIFIWDTKTWTKTHEILGHTRPIQALAFNSTSTQLISTGADDVVKIWEMSSLKKEKISLLGSGANFYGAKFIGRTNDFGMATLQQGARLYTAQKTMRGWLTGHANQGTLAVDFNPAATWGVTAGRDNNASLFDMKTMNRKGSFKGHQDWVTTVQFSPNGKWLATASSDHTVKVWNPYTFALVTSLPDQKAVGSPIAFTADGKYMFTVDISDNLVISTLNPPQGSSAPATKAKRSGKRGG
jgi:WD40 repeat protein